MDVVAFLISLMGVWLNIKKKKEGFLIWIVSNILWIIYNCMHKSYIQAFLFLVFVGTSIYGYIKWKRTM